MTLDDIFIECQTDKSSLTHGYAPTYEKYLESWRDKEFTMLEIGISSGGSLRSWRKYFPKAKIFGIDNNPDCKMDGAFIGDQSDFSFLQSVLDEIGAPDVIVEDGSHYGPFTILTFEYLFPRMKEGGLFFVEDSHCFYDTTYGCAPPNHGMSEVFKFFTSLACDVDVHGRGYCGNADYAMKLENPNFAPVPKYSPLIESMHIHTSLWLFKRR